MTDKHYLTVKEAAEYLNMAEATLNCWRSNKTYPLPYYKLGRSVRYKAEDLEAFVSQQIH